MNSQTDNPVTRFLQDFHHNDALREKAVALAEQPEQLAEWLQSKGYAFTPEQWQEAVAAHAALPDNVLEGVAGGTDGVIDYSKVPTYPYRKAQDEFLKKVGDFFSNLF